MNQEHDAAIREILRVSRAGSSGWARGKCPMCDARTGKADRRGALGVRADTGIFHCFRCGASGKLDGFADGDGWWDDRDRGPRPPPPHPEGFVRLDSDDGRGSLALQPAWSYLRIRGVTAALVASARIGACATGKHAGRVVVPVLADDGDTWLGWVARSWFKRSPVPYLYPAGMDRGRVLYNHRALLVETDEPALVVEGVFDALALWPHAVAVLGKPTEDQVEALRLARRPVVALLDGDAHEESEMLALRLRFDGQRAGAVRLPATLDPDQVPRSVVEEAARRSLHTDGPVIADGSRA